MTTQKPRILPPITGTPLDFVPIDAPVQKITPTRYRINPLKRGLAAGGWCISIAAALFILVVTTGVI
ncbi:MULTISPECIES: hypothetical protein [unclassified Sinorhizobium]|uniref:hypothetical protein n=1 Tax=unclassified Sinorhizobium TaxID=2613772 RepID=UPI00352325F0